MKFKPGINITHMTQPESGGVLAGHCSKCKTTVILQSPYSKKPEDGDLFLMEMCFDNELHNFAGLACGGISMRHRSYFPWVGV
jgi:hypothetical protein